MLLFGLAGTALVPLIAARNRAKAVTTCLKQRGHGERGRGHREREETWRENEAGVDTAAVVHVTRGETKNVEKNTALAQFPLYITARVHG